MLFVRVLAVVAAIALAPQPARSQPNRRIVVLHSYHQGLSWVDAINAGLTDVFGRADPTLDLRFEYLDTKAHTGPDYLELQARLLARKYRNTPPALVVACDNNALAFVREHRERVFGRVPVVFCGINNFSEALLQGLDRVTGVAEAVSFRENLELIRRLYPDLGRIVVYGADTTTFRANRERMVVAARALGMEGLLEFRGGLSVGEAREDIGTLPAGAVAVLIETLRTDRGVPLGFGEACRRLREASSIPLHSFWDTFFGYGIVGGKLVSGADQGRAAARLALRVLAGADAGTLPVIREGSNPWVFDYRELVRFGIDPGMLPPGSHVRFQPPGLWERYGKVLGPGLGVFGLLGLLALFQAADATRQRRAKRAIRRARDFLQTVIDGVAEPILVIGPDYRVKLRNRAAREASASPDAQTCHGLSHGSDAPCTGEHHPCPLEQVRQTGEAVTVTHVHEGPAGEPRQVEILASPLRDAEGRVTGIVETVRDVTDRVRAFEQVRRAKEEWEKTFDAVPDLIALIGPDRRIRRVNRALAERLGVDPRSLVGRCCFEVFHGTAEPHPQCPHARSLQGGRPRVAEVHEPHLGGHFFVSTSALPGPDGRNLGCVHVARDITDLKRAQHALEAERHRLRVTLESIGDGVIATDPQGRVTLLNPTAEQLTGWSEGEALGRPLAEVFRIVNEATREPATNPVDEVIATGRVVGLANHTVLIGRDGTERAIADSAAPIRDDAGQVVGVVLVFRDVTEERQREAERARAQHLESLGVLAGGIAHDFNNLLMGISANLEAARRKVAPTDPAYTRLSQAEAACFRATHLTRQLLTFARGGDPVRRRVNLAEHLEEWASFPLRGSNVALDLHLPSGLWPLEADPGQLEQVITNLVLNARQAMPRGGAVRVSARNREIGPGDHPGLEPGRYLEIEVADTGIGIPDEHLPKIFDPYFTTKQAGSGLGLATAHSIVRRHGGAVSVESRLGEGTRVRILLPAAAVGEPSRPPHALPEAHGAAASQGRRRILVMDDEEIIRDVVVEVLKDMGYEPEVAADGREAVERYRAAQGDGAPFDLVILDLTVPAGMGGLEALNELRRIDPGVRAVASSGYASDPVLAEPRRYGFAASVAKPYRLAELSRVIETVLAAGNTRVTNASRL
ncbi:MAG: PAS domain-containing protein [Deltaproteobacteria bacterium]|nr:PAS domain-containing protein [Deltaproteobacteria bacterium]